MQRLHSAVNRFVHVEKGGGARSFSQYKRLAEVWARTYGKDLIASHLEIGPACFAETFQRFRAVRPPEKLMQQKILIVDDHPAMRKIIRQLIEQESGWQVCGEAANGAEGVSAVERLRPSIVVLDLSMPVMDGIEAAILIKKLRPETRLLMFTSYPTPSIEEAARAVGVEAFVAKSNGDMALLEGLHRVATLPSAFRKGA